MKQNYEKTEKQYLEAVERGEKGAQCKLGFFYFKKKQYSQAAEAWMADQDNKQSQYMLGRLYETGRGVEKNYEEATRWYRKAADQEYAKAQYQLGRLYETGRGVEKNYEEATRLYREAAENGDAEAQYKLGRLYETGRGVEKNYIEAARWYRKSAEQKYAKAQYHLGFLYETGRAGRDYKEAKRLYSDAVKKKHKEAQYRLGVLYENGQGVKRNDAKAAELYLELADQGHKDAKQALVKLYEQNRIEDEACKNRAQWYQEEPERERVAEAEECRQEAEKGDAEAQYELGGFYENGHGVEQSDADAAKWYLDAAEQGHEEAKQAVLRFYEQDRIEDEAYKQRAQCCQEEQERERAKECQEAAEKGDAEAQYELGSFYEKGYGVEQSDADAAKWYLDATKQGHEEAKEALIMFYEQDRIEDEDCKKLAQWYQEEPERERAAEAEECRQKAEKGDEAAQYILGSFYEDGYGVDQSDKEAAKWYLKAAKQGHEEAKDALIMFYRQDRIEDEDCKKQAEWYQDEPEREFAKECRQAAEKGDIEAKYELGSFYEEGEGVEQSDKDAAKWYLDAAKQGHEEAKQALIRFYEQDRIEDEDCKQQAQLFKEEPERERAEKLRKEAEKGDAEAQFKLGDFYERGHGVEESDADAAKWYLDAAEQGHKKAKQALIRLFEQDRIADEACKQQAQRFKEELERERADEAEKLKKALADRNIKWLYHFTRAENLETILSLGLLPKKFLEEANVLYQENDPKRLDYSLDSSSASIGFPNYKFFYTLRNNNPDVDWVVLSLNANSIFGDPKLSCVCCWTNAARKEVSSQRLSERTTFFAFNKMFEDLEGCPKREDTGIPPCYPTDPQAEVLICGKIPPEYIGRIYFEDENTLEKYQSDIPYGEKACVNKKFFGPRSDYESWRS